jgi:glycosyltransferase involved in cell wall biosynthesis
LKSLAPLASDKEYGLTISDRARGVSNVEFISGVPFFEIDKYFSNAKIFVNTSKYEGFPNTFVQASMHGVPIISLNVNPDRILNEYSIGFFALNNPDRLKNDLELLLNNHEQYYKYSENAYNYAKEKHSIDAIVLNILNILNSLI